MSSCYIIVTTGSRETNASDEHNTSFNSRQVESQLKAAS